MKNWGKLEDITLAALFAAALFCLAAALGWEGFGI